jgi:hypothetical protein
VTETVTGKKIDCSGTEGTCTPYSPCASLY